MCFFYFPFVTLIQINRNDQSEGGNGRPVISRVCGEKKSSSGEASLETNTNKSNNTQCPQELKIWPTSMIYDSHSIPSNTGPFFFKLKCRYVYDPSKALFNYISAHAFVHLLCVSFISFSLHLADAIFFCRYLQRVVSHPSLLQDPDVREFLEREDVGILRYKMILQ